MKKSAFLIFDVIVTNSKMSRLVLTLTVLFLQERRITPSEALNHPFVSMSHMADYAHCANVKSSARMMELCCKRNSHTNNNPQHPQALQTQLMVPR